MKTIEDQYIDIVIRDNLLAELSAGTGADFVGTDGATGFDSPVNDLETDGREPVVSDVEIEREVRQALQHDPAVPFDRMATSVHDGWVTLEGRVDHAYEKEEAEEVVLGLGHVRGIIDHVAVGPDGRCIPAD
jgi:hypothetical protein